MVYGREFLIKWKHFPLSQSTWEPENFISKNSQVLEEYLSKPPEIEDNFFKTLEKDYKFKTILEERRYNDKAEYKIEWNGLSISTWEPEDSIPFEILNEKVKSKNYDEIYSIWNNNEKDDSQSILTSNFTSSLLVPLDTDSSNEQNGKEKRKRGRPIGFKPKRKEIVEKKEKSPPKQPNPRPIQKFVLPPQKIMIQPERKILPRIVPIPITNVTIGPPIHHHHPIMNYTDKRERPLKRKTELDDFFVEDEVSEEHFHVDPNNGQSSLLSILNTEEERKSDKLLDIYLVIDENKEEPKKDTQPSQTKELSPQPKKKRGRPSNKRPSIYNEEIKVKEEDKSPQNLIVQQPPTNIKQTTAQTNHIPLQQTENTPKRKRGRPPKLKITEEKVKKRGRPKKETLEKSDSEEITDEEKMKKEKKKKEKKKK